MKTIKILSILFFAGFCSANAQNVESTSSRTSGGLEAGGATSGTGNTFYGYRTGKITTSTGLNNTFIGHQSGKANTTGDSNIFIGAVTGEASSTGSSNILIGNYAGGEMWSGSGNVMIGSSAGVFGNGSRNIFIGNSAGEYEMGNDKLYISNDEDESPLIWGDFALDQLKFNGKVGIGNSFGNYPTTAGSVDVSAYNLFVKGGILTEEVRISEVSTWADYVFANDYKLPTLVELEDFIAKNGHLPNVPSAKQVQEDGIALGEMAKIQQEKIEELTLYIIEQNRVNEKQAKELDEQKMQIQELKALVAKLIDSNN